MKHVHSKTILGIVVTIAFLLGSVATPVAALQTNMIEESFNYSFAPGANNHTYIYSPSDDPSFLSSLSYNYYTDDTDLTTYNYESNGWSSPDTSYSEDTSLQWSWTSVSEFSGGTYGNSFRMPKFYDFVGSDGSPVVVNTTIERRSFALAFGVTTPIAMDSDYTYFGTLAISGQEFVHLRVACLQDGFTWTVFVHDPEGRQIASASGTGGDIIVLPFRPSTAGTYIVTMDTGATNGERALFELYPEAIAPTLIAPNEVVTDTLPTGEILTLEGSGSWVQDELIPTVKTYKIDPGTEISALTYAFNYPTGLFGATQPVSIILTNDAFFYGTNGGSRYSNPISFPTYDVFNFRGGVHYVTVMGGDNTDFTLYHEADVATDLIVNEEFKVENIFSHDVVNVYNLTVPENSVLKCNTTNTGNFEQWAWTTLDSGYRQFYSIADGSTLLSSQYYYLPAGEYVVEVEVGPYSSEYMEFTLQPLINGTSANIVNVGGFIVPTDACHEYNLTVTLGNHYNVSVPMEIGIYNQFYTNYYSYVPTLGTWFDGSSTFPHSTHETSIEYDFAARTWSDDYAIIIIAAFPYNNTAGVGDYFEDFPVEISINWEDTTHDYFEDTAHIDAGASSGAYNFSLALLGDSFESYAVFLNATPGTWYNVTIGSQDVSSIDQVTSYTPLRDYTYMTTWTDLNDEFQGGSGDWSFQFGAITDTIWLEFDISRALAVEGHLWVQFTPMDTYQLEHPDPLESAGLDILSLLGGIAVPLGIGVVVIVVVAVVYVKKFKK